MKLILSLVAALAASGCSSVNAPKTVTLPDGRVANMAYCDGTQNSMAGCLNVAAAKCGGAYEIVDRSEGNSISGASINGMGSVSSMPRREIAYICKS